MQFPSDGTPSSASVNIMCQTGGVIEPGYDARGLLDGWPIKIEIVDPDNTNLGKFDMMPNSTIGNVVTDSHGLATISVNGALNKTRREVTEHYALTGREDLGDDRCKIPICPADIGRGVAFVRPDVATGLLHVNDAYGRVRCGSPSDDVIAYHNVYFECTTAGTTDATTAPTYDPTVGNSTTDGTATFIARNAWLRYARGAAVDTFNIQLTELPDSRASDSTWYVLGGIYIRSGPLKNVLLPVRAWDGTTFVATTFLPLTTTDIPTGTQMEIYAGCDLTREQCYSRFNNIINLRAETFVPPSNLLIGI
jgi:hypothetical protein